MTCQTSGTFAHWKLMEAQGGTFVEFEGGMEPRGVMNRLFDETAGRIWFRRWVAQSLEALLEAADKDGPAAAAGAGDAAGDAATDAAVAPSPPPAKPPANPR